MRLVLRSTATTVLETMGLENLGAGATHELMNKIFIKEQPLRYRYSRDANDNFTNAIP